VIEDVEGVQSEPRSRYDSISLVSYQARTLPLPDCAKTVPATIVTITIAHKAETNQRNLRLVDGITSSLPAKTIYY
jgi:hypothetical protein